MRDSKFIEGFLSYTSKQYTPLGVHTKSHARVWTGWIAGTRLRLIPQILSEAH